MELKSVHDIFIIYVSYINVSHPVGKFIKSLVEIHKIIYLNNVMTKFKLMLNVFIYVETCQNLILSYFLLKAIGSRYLSTVSQNKRN